MSELQEKYEVLKLIATGGFSTVYKVEDKADGKIYALKMLDIDDTAMATDSQHLNTDSNVYADFINEVEILKKLNSPNVVKIYEQLVLDNKPCILMEYVEGKTLEKILEEKNILSEKEVEAITLQISAGLMHCHNLQYNRSQAGYLTETQLISENAIIHNDIHPKNIICEDLAYGNYRYVLIDFGLSFTNPKKVSDSFIQNGMAEYKSPEKWEEKKPKPPSDIYSFGIMLYRCLAGELPFAVENPNNFAELEALKNAHLYNAPPDLWETRKANLEKYKNISLQKPDYPFWMQQLVEKCLEKKPEDRFRTVAELNRTFLKGTNGELPADWPVKEDPHPDPIPLPLPEATPRPKAPPAADPSETIYSPIINPQQKANFFSIKKLGFLVGLFLLIILGVFAWKKYGNATNDTITESRCSLKADISDNRTIVQDYLQKDAAIKNGNENNEKEIQEIAKLFAYPTIYFDKTLNSEKEFVTNYSYRLLEVKECNVAIDSIIQDKVNKNLFTISGVMSKVTKNSKGNPVKRESKIIDKIELSNRKIVSIQKTK